jgi:hypothetical protein
LRVTDDYPSGDTAFTGTLKCLELASGEDIHDHVDPLRTQRLIRSG